MDLDDEELKATRILNGVDKLKKVNKTTYRELLISLNFNVKSKGFKYWITGLEIYKKDNFRYGFTMEYLYNEIAHYYNTNRNKVERAIRTASEPAIFKIYEKYRYCGKITTKTIFELIANDESEVY